MTVRTLVVDDSPTMRTVIARTLSRDPAIEVVGTADGPVSARSLIKELNPDVITLDVEMPDMNGLDFLEKVMRLRPMPVVMLSSQTQAGASATIRALELGAFDCLAKPERGWGEDDNGLARMVRAAATSRRNQYAARTARPALPTSFTPRPDALIAIGSSTGGVEALIEVIGGFPVNCPPTVIVQHLPAKFTTTFAARMDRLCPPKVVEAKSGDRLEPGHVYLAPGGTHHLEVRGDAQRHCRLVADELMSGHRPSVDRLFHSVAATAGASAVGCILTGMGEDGALGLKAMRDRGAATIGQDEATSVVYGMPAAAWELGAVVQQFPLGRIAGQLLDRCRA